MAFRIASVKNMEVESSISQNLNREHTSEADTDIQQQLRICEKKPSRPQEHKQRCSASFSLTDQVPGDETTNVPEASEACIDICSLSFIFLQRIIGSLGKV
ncbi:predicted protein [Histoplasma capsulatum G186AR]|uniref:Uncharacterized protein n=1 Tax=Ajellomyces capsulatus (strain G186AR / H82 / ATCC MYA-2454 / RMSCC 2432) TaxID=447093 RepID=C0NQY3_AJECG|nr:uncharacterized protein HCBG_05413 [Histoplasma capsulatum G186AR]EEH06097.1 predicted protein [Histoplasma capsulatum G186AR]